MYLSHFLLHLVTLLFVIHATNSEEQDDEWWRKQLSDIANLQMINDTTEILNLKTVVQRYGKHGHYIWHVLKLGSQGREFFSRSSSTEGMSSYFLKWGI